MHNTHSYGESVGEFKVGQRVATHPATDAFMSGDRYGEVVAVGRTRVTVKLDRSGRTVRFAAWNLAHMAAERLLDAGVTRIDRVKVAEVLREHAEGTAPSMIARKLSVGYSTVVRILEHHTAQPAQ